MIIDLLSSLLACLALYGFVRAILAKQKRKVKSRLKHDPSKSIGKADAIIESQDYVNYRTIVNAESWKQMAKLTDKQESK